MNVLLVESHYRTRSWHLGLQDLAGIYVISTMPGERKLFESQGVLNDNILDFHHPNLCLYDAVEIVVDLKEIEKELSINISEIVSQDRTLRKKEPEYINKYAFYVFDQIQKFITGKNIQVAFLEPTWFHDLAVERFFFSNNIPVFCPRNDRFLKNKFVFFKGALFNECFIRNRLEESVLLVDKTINAVLGDQKPLNFHKYSSRNKFRFAKLMVLFRLVRLAILGEKNDNLQPSFFESIYWKIMAILKVYYFSKISPF